MTVGSLFAGIGGFDLGFARAGFTIAWRCEIEAFPRKVLTAKMPGPVIYGDVRALSASVAPAVDVLVGGFPCQDLSIAGRRGGLGGERSGLFFQFVRLIREFRPRWWVIENVPGFFTSAAGSDFACALRELDGCGYVGSWRVLDSQYFGLAQRRERVFLVGCLGGLGDGPQTVLFESARGGGHSAPGVPPGPDLAATLRGRSHGVGVNMPGRGGEDDQNLICGPLGRGNDGIGRRSEDDPNLVTYALGSHATCADGDQTNRSHARGGPVGLNIRQEVAYALREGRTQAIAATLNSAGNTGGFRTEPGEHLVVDGERARALVGTMFKRHDDDTDTLIPIASALSASLGHHGHSSPRGDGTDNLIPFDTTQITSRLNRSAPEGGNPCHPLSAGAHAPAIAYALRTDPGGIGQGHNTTFPGGVRRLTPLECERLQGFPDGWTCLCGQGHLGSDHCACADSPRYRALGNAVSVPVAEWIAHRIRAADGDL